MTVHSYCITILCHFWFTKRGQDPFVFTQQRFKLDGQERTYFELTDQCREGHFSSGLQELNIYYTNRMSYEEVEKLVERMTGKRSLSDQWIWHGVIAKSVEVSQ